MTAPVRLQLSRAKGFNLQAASRAVNGRAAVVVARPSRWGNPYRVCEAVETDQLRMPAITPERAVILFRERWADMLASPNAKVAQHARSSLDEIRGFNLANELNVTVLEQPA